MLKIAMPYKPSFGVSVMVNQILEVMFWLDRTNITK